MTEEAIKQDPTAPESAPASAETAAQVWERTVAPITTDDVKGTKPAAKAAEGDPPPAEPKERTLVAPQLAALVKPVAAAEPNPLEERLARIEAALIPATEPKAPELQEEVRELRNLIVQRDEDAATAAAAATRNEQLNLLREGVISNIRADAERFPLLVALNQEENVYNELITQLEDGKEVSEDDIASKAEAKLQAALDRMNEVTGGKTVPTTSQEPAKSNAPAEPKTLTPTLSASDGPTDVESILESKGGDRRAAAAEMWDNIMNG